MLREKVCKTHIADLELSTTPLLNGCRNDDAIQLGHLRSQSLFQCVQINDAYFEHLLFTICPIRCNQRDSNLANLEEATVTVEQIINSGVSLHNNSMVSHAPWKFYLSQGNVKTFVYTILQQIYLVNYVPNFIKIAGVL